MEYESDGFGDMATLGSTVVMRRRDGWIVAVLPTASDAWFVVRALGDEFRALDPFPRRALSLTDASACGALGRLLGCEVADRWRRCFSTCHSDERARSEAEARVFSETGEAREAFERREASGGWVMTARGFRGVEGQSA